MKVLFWVDTFPAVSETFIRDQIISLLNNNINVLIHTSDNSREELQALKGYEKYQLSKRKININKSQEYNKFARVIRAFFILLSSFFTRNFKYYIRALSYKKYGHKARSLKLFYQVHFILKNRIEIIHAHFGPNGVKASFLKELGLPIKLFTTFHGYDIRLGNQKGGIIYKNLFKHCNGIFSISNYNYDNLVQFGCNETLIYNLENGINTSFFKRKKRIRVNSSIKILSVARLVKEKSLHIAIEAVCNIIKLNPNLEIDYEIIGEGSERNKLENIIKQKKINHKIKLIGAKDSNEVRNKMINSHVFLLSSKAEALPTVLLEAQSSEMIILATDVGNVKEIVKGGKVVKDLDINSFVTEFNNLLLNKDEWSDLAKKGRDYVLKHHDISVQTKKLIAFYEA